MKHDDDYSRDFKSRSSVQIIYRKPVQLKTAADVYFAVRLKLRRQLNSERLLFASTFASPLLYFWYEINAP